MLRERDEEREERDTDEDGPIDTEESWAAFEAMAKRIGLRMLDGKAGEK